MTPRSVRLYVLTSAAVAALGIVGCGDEDEAAPVPQPTAQQQQPAPGGDAAPQQPPTQFDNVPGAQTSAPPAQDASGATADPSPPASDTPAAPEPQGRTPSPPQAAPRQEPARQGAAGATANTPEAKARALIEILQAQKSETKWDEGEKTIQELEKLKPSLSREMRDEVDNERASFRVARQIFKQDR